MRRARRRDTGDKASQTKSCAQKCHLSPFWAQLSLY